MLFVPEIPQEDLRKERALARALRGSTWWKRKRATGRCYYCGAHVSPGNLTMDHLIPLIRGGRSTKNNIVAACKECNSRKKYLLPLEWETYLTSLSEDD
ncbi:MAG TPA: HNH endonuclease [Dissulfurispiraceae bacterium]|nr:HNH endonuclease [Dissulfurispiraceae bacterium]